MFHPPKLRSGCATAFGPPNRLSRDSQSKMIRRIEATRSTFR